MNNHKESNIQIPRSLFLNCVKLLCCEVSDTKLLADTQNALETKLEALMRRELYTAYKTASTDEEREQARQKYLDHVGIPKDFRWGKDWDGQ